jgi:hypothetical protein
MTGIFEKQPGGGFIELNVRGRLVSRTGGTDNYEDVDVSGFPDETDPAQFQPLPPLLSVTMNSRTQASLTWVPQAQTPPHEAVDYWEVYRAQDDPTGGDGILITTRFIDLTAYTDGPLATNTPEIQWTYRVYARSASGLRRSSNAVTVQWAATPLSQPTPPTSLVVSDVQATSVHLSWNATADATVTKYAIFQGTTIIVNDIPPSAVEWDLTGLTTGQNYTNISVRRYNGWAGGTVPGWSNASNTVSFKPLTREVQYAGHVPGRIYFGWSTSEQNSVADNQLNTQTPFSALAPSQNYSDLLGVFRLYSKVASDISYIDARGRVLWLSMKTNELGGGTSAGTAGWAQVANGSVSDAQIINYFDDLVARNKMTIWTFHHEPLGDATNSTDAANFIAANLRIMQLVDDEFGGRYDATTNPSGHRIVFCPNYEEFKLRTPGSTNWAQFLPENMLPGKGGPRPWDFITFDCYQYNANTSTSQTAGVQFSHRAWRMENIFKGTFTPTGSTAMPYMDYTPGYDIVLGIGEGTQRPGAFYNFENGLAQASNMTGAKYTRDYLDYIFAHADIWSVVSWFNSIGSDPIYNDERLWPDSNSWGGDNPGHPSFVQQTGDTEYAINIYREKLRGPLTIKLASNGLPPT